MTEADQRETREAGRPIAVISDVHANLPALEAVLAEIDARGIDRIWCLGDTIGYGPFPVECVELVAARSETTLAGNHDLIVRGDVSLSMFRGSAEQGIVFARERLAEPHLSWLGGLPTQLIREDESVELYHASARDPVWEYVIDTTVASAHLQLQRLPLSLVGHSHAQLLYSRDVTPGGPNQGQTVGGRVGAGTFRRNDGQKTVVNPGAVGQPRDGDWRAAFAVLHGDNVEFLRVEYDVERMRQAVLDAGLPASTGNRLLSGQ